MTFLLAASPGACDVMLPVLVKVSASVAIFCVSGRLHGHAASVHLKKDYMRLSEPLM